MFKIITRGGFGHSTKLYYNDIDLGEKIGGFYRAKVIIDVQKPNKIILHRWEYKGLNLEQIEAKIVEIFSENPVTKEKGEFVLIEREYLNKLLNRDEC